MRDGMQSFLKSAGESGCYALCLIDVAEEYSGRHIDAVQSLLNAAEKGYIKYNWDNPGDGDNMYVEYPGLFLESMTGKKWTVTKEEPAMALRGTARGVYVISRYESSATGVTYGHFERENFHPIRNSRTVENGRLVSTRVCRVSE